MPFVPALNTVRVAVSYISATGEQGVNVQHFRHNAGAVTVPAINSLLFELKDWYTLSWKFCASQDWQTDIFEVRDLTTAEGIQVSDVETISGAVNSPGLPAQNTIAISTRSGFTGRSRRGRVFHVGLAESMVVGSRVTLGAATDLVSYYNNLTGGLAEGDWTWVVASFVSNGAPRLTALLTPITNVVLADTVVDSMDTRKPQAV